MIFPRGFFPRCMKIVKGAGKARQDEADQQQ